MGGQLQSRLNSRHRLRLAFISHLGLESLKWRSIGRFLFLTTPIPNTYHLIVILCILLLTLLLMLLIFFKLVGPLTDLHIFLLLPILCGLTILDWCSPLLIQKQILFLLLELCLTCLLLPLLGSGLGLGRLWTLYCFLWFSGHWQIDCWLWRLDLGSDDGLVVLLDFGGRLRRCLGPGWSVWLLRWCLLRFVLLAYFIFQEGRSSDGTGPLNGALLGWLWIFDFTGLIGANRFHFLIGRHPVDILWGYRLFLGLLFYGVLSTRCCNWLLIH